MRKIIELLPYEHASEGSEDESSDLIKDYKTESMNNSQIKMLDGILSIIEKFNKDKKQTGKLYIVLINCL